jgi:anti-sigma factor RsiW
MYDCSTTMKLIHAHLDGELDVKESLRVQTHLQECRYCRENFQAEAEYRELLRQHVAPNPAPEFSRQCVSAALSREIRQNRRNRSRWRPARLMAPSGVVAAAAVLVLAFVGVFSEPVPPLVRMAVANHRAYLDNPRSLQILSDDPAAVAAWVRAHVSFDLVLPADGVPDLRLVGAGVASDSDPQAVHLVYRLGNDTVSLLATPSREIRLSGRDVIAFKNILFHPADVTGFHTLQWSDRRHTYVLVSEQSSAVNRACVICHGSEQGRAVIDGFLQGI